MLVKEIKQLLLGKTISHHDGFNGSSDYFRIGHLTKCGLSVRAFVEKGRGFGIFIPIEAVNTLVENGEYREKDEIEGCTFERVWKLH
ncbi:MAG: hypothetical protein NC324_02565 [Bacteroides sp.]|nr:hypothetical protein [Bacteroides sp.]